MTENISHPEKAIAIAVARKGSDRARAFAQLAEIALLAETAGAEIVEKIYQELDKPNPKTYLGKGKVDEIKLTILESGIQLVIFDDELTPAQLKNLGNEFKIKVIDRSWLILDIFARHARSVESKTQVELAQLQYLLPRLSRMWTHLSKQYGGIGTRGPGETQIETDRRILKDRIQTLKRKIEDIDVQRSVQRSGRSGMPRFALVGYTNAGKSTLMNALTNAAVGVEDKLFATLDTTVRSFILPSGQKALLSDTVGFIRKLPTHLIASFRSTLAEAFEADILIHVVDITGSDFREQIHVVYETLEHLKISRKPAILAFNKIDAVASKDELISLSRDFLNSIFISASRGINLNALLSLMQAKYDEQDKLYGLFIPYGSMAAVSGLYNIGEIIERIDRDNGVSLKIKIHPEKRSSFENKYKQFINKL